MRGMNGPFFNSTTQFAQSSKAPESEPYLFSTNDLTTFLLLKPDNKNHLQMAMRQIIREGKFMDLINYAHELSQDPKKADNHNQLQTLLRSKHLEPIWESVFKGVRNPFNKQMELKTHELCNTQKLKQSPSFQQLSNLENLIAIGLGENAYDQYWYYYYGCRALSNALNLSISENFTELKKLFIDDMNKMKNRLGFTPNTNHAHLITAWEISLPKENGLEAINNLNSETYKFFEFLNEQRLQLLEIANKAALHHSFAGLWVKAIMRIDEVNENQQQNFNLKEIQSLGQELKSISDEMIKYYAGVGYAVQALFHLATAKLYRDLKEHLTQQSRSNLFSHHSNSIQNLVVDHYYNATVFSQAALSLEKYSQNLNILTFPKIVQNNENFNYLITEFFNNQLGIVTHNKLATISDINISSLTSLELCTNSDRNKLVKSCQQGKAIAGEFLTGDKQHFMRNNNKSSMKI